MGQMSKSGPRKTRGKSGAVKPATKELGRAKEALRRKLADSLAMMRATLESTTDAIVLTDGVGKLTGFNGKYAELMGLSRAAINRMGVRQLRGIFSRQFKDPQKFIKETKAIYAAGRPQTFDIIEFVDGRIFERYSKLQKIDNRTVGR